MKRYLLLPLMIASLNAADFSTLFTKGQKNFGFGVSSSSSFGNNYTVVGANFSYFLQDNLSVGAGYQGWFGGDPKINEISIPITYYFPLNAQYHPYVGGIYRHTFIEDPHEDYDVIGGRVGVAVTLGTNAYMSVGWVQEQRSHGDESTSDGYPEVSMGFVF